MSTTSNHDYGSFLVVAYDGTHRGVVRAFTEEKEAQEYADFLHKEAEKNGTGTTYVVQTKQSLEDTPYSVPKPKPEVKVEKVKPISTPQAIARSAGLEDEFTGKSEDSDKKGAKSNG